MIIRAAVTCSDLKKSTQILLKTVCNSVLATLTSAITDAIYGLEIFSRYYATIKKLTHCERFMNQIKIDRIVSNHLSSCKLSLMIVIDF